MGAYFNWFRSPRRDYRVQGWDRKEGIIIIYLISEKTVEMETSYFQWFLKHKVRVILN
ncbi:hypothetical protein LEP1GSC101_3806 [Leptospira borgpetersenii str. UI 09149]|nr:hypothetical protein LEP1GSC101_3806 [Leptospira borgpetersenii str. UI 09149]